MYAEKIDVNSVIMSEVYCKKWIREWDILYAKINGPLEKLKTKKTEVGEFYVKIAKKMDITPDTVGEVSSETTGLMAQVDKLKKMHDKAYESFAHGRADKMQTLNNQIKEQET
jgi:hypothetical protein